MPPLSFATPATITMIGQRVETAAAVNTSRACSKKTKPKRMTKTGMNLWCGQLQTPGLPHSPSTSHLPPLHGQSGQAQSVSGFPQPLHVILFSIVHPLSNVDVNYIMPFFGEKIKDKKTVQLDSCTVLSLTVQPVAACSDRREGSSATYLPISLRQT